MGDLGPTLTTCMGYVVKVGNEPGQRILLNIKAPLENVNRDPVVYGGCGGLHTYTVGLHPYTLVHVYT